MYPSCFSCSFWSLRRKSCCVLKSLRLKAFLRIFLVKGDGLLPSADLRNVDLPHPVGPATINSLFLLNKSYFRTAVQTLKHCPRNVNPGRYCNFGFALYAALGPGARWVGISWIVLVIADALDALLAADVVEQWLFFGESVRLLRYAIVFCESVDRFSFSFLRVIVAGVSHLPGCAYCFQAMLPGG